MADERLRRKDRIQGAKQYRDHFRNARRRETPALVVYARFAEEPRIRLGFTVSRKVGSAVQRNRVKRRLREIFRKRKASWRQSRQGSPVGLDLVIRPKPDAALCTYGELEKQLDRAVMECLTARPRRR